MAVLLSLHLLGPAVAQYNLTTISTDHLHFIPGTDHNDGTEAELKVMIPWPVKVSVSSGAFEASLMGGNAT